jgi:hypothetical protein
MGSSTSAIGSSNSNETEILPLHGLRFFAAFSVMQLV